MSAQPSLRKKYLLSMGNQGKYWLKPRCPIATPVLARPVRRSGGYKREGRLKSFLCGQLMSPLAGARRLKPCPWKAKYSAGALSEPLINIRIEGANQVITHHIYLAS